LLLGTLLASPTPDRGSPSRARPPRAGTCHTVSRKTAHIVQKYLCSDNPTHAPSRCRILRVCLDELTPRLELAAQPWPRPLYDRFRA
jgi:hypothetical protein